MSRPLVAVVPHEPAEPPCPGYCDEGVDCCPSNRGLRPMDFKWFAVRTNKSCPANAAAFDPRTTLAGFYDDVVSKRYGRGTYRVCPHAAARAWLDAITEGLRSETFCDQSNDSVVGEAFTRRVVRHLEVAAELGFGRWMAVQGVIRV